MKYARMIATIKLSSEAIKRTTSDFTFKAIGRDFARNCDPRSAALRGYGNPKHVTMAPAISLKNRHLFSRPSFVSVIRARYKRVCETHTHMHIRIQPCTRISQPPTLFLTLLSFRFSGYGIGNERSIVPVVALSSSKTKKETERERNA